MLFFCSPPEWRGRRWLASGLGFDVVLGGELEDLCRWVDLRRGRLQDRVSPRRPEAGRCRVRATPGHILAGGQLAVIVHRGAEGLPLSVEVAVPGALGPPSMRKQALVLTVMAAGRGWLSRAERLDLPVRVASAELGVGGDGQLAGPGGGVLPRLTVGHGLGKGLLVLLVVVSQSALAGGQLLVARSAAVVAGFAGSLGFGGGADGA